MSSEKSDVMTEPVDAGAEIPTPDPEQEQDGVEAAADGEDQAESLSDEQLDEVTAAVGAVLFASGEPVTLKELAAALGGLERLTMGIVLDRLEAELDRSVTGLRLERIAGGYRIATRSDVGAWVRQFFRQRNRTRLSPAALETLAIIAYRQPVTAPEIQAIRAKDPGASLRSLLDKKMIKILGKKKVVGSPLLYGSSKQFLVHFGLNSLRDLPSIDEFDEFAGVLDGGQGQMFDAGEVEIEELDASPDEILGGDETEAASEDVDAVNAAMETGAPEPCESSPDGDDEVEALEPDPEAVAVVPTRDEDH